MSNTWFRFRQFTIHQGSCAMKVTTDACIQGAWTPIPFGATHVLDIGTGTGLLSLMLAQRSTDLQISSVEYDAAAAEQAKENVAASPWGGRMTVQHTDVRTYTPSVLYDVIICNPPFFSASLLSDKPAKNMARHDVTLTADELLNFVSTHLSPTGMFSLLLPADTYRQWQPLMAEYGLFEQSSLHIRHRPDGQVKRMVNLLAKHRPENEARHQLLTIQDELGAYTEEFTTLLNDFYLNLQA